MGKMRRRTTERAELPPENASAPSIAARQRDAMAQLSAHRVSPD
jgi:hypothetical protein